jgi:hypothetical protein
MKRLTKQQKALVSDVFREYGRRGALKFAQPLRFTQVPLMRL